MLLLIVMVLLLLSRIIRLRLARCERLAADVRLLVVAVLVALVGAAHLARLLLLIIIFRRNRIARALRVAGKLEIFFGDVRSCSANLYVRPVGLVHSG